MGVIAAMAAGTVLIFAFCGIGRPRNYMRAAFGLLFTGMLLIVASPIAPGFDARSDRTGHFYTSRFGAHTGGVLCAMGIACMLAAAGFHRPTTHHGEPPEMD